VPNRLFTHKLRWYSSCLGGAGLRVLFIMTFEANEQLLEFRQTNADAHRVTPTDFDAPALICHQAFWIAPRARQSMSAIWRVKIKRMIDSFLLATARNIQSHIDSDVRIEPRVGNVVVLFSNIAAAKHLVPDPRFRLTDARLNYDILTDPERAIFDSDHRVISIHFHWFGLQVKLRFEMHGEYFVVTTFIELAGTGARTLPKFGKTLDQLRRYDQLPSAEAIQITQFLYERIWDIFARAIFPSELFRSKANQKVFANIFADARGLVLSGETVAFDGIRFAAPTEWPTGAENLVKKYLPLLRPIGAERDRRYECSVSYILDGRAIYMTSLGPQIPQLAARRRVPVTYLLCAHPTVTEWQRGRIIDLVQLMGVNRLAALKDLSALRDAGRQLASLDQHIVTARDAVPTGDEEETAKAIRRAHDQFNMITGTFNAGTRTNYGILYRVERSRYYVSRFRSNIAQLRIWRLEGYQKYDLFVEQRLGSTFDFIDRLGRRYERAINSLSLLDEYNLSIQSNVIAKSQRDMESKETEISDRIAKIQRYGEFILIFALLPYYIIGLISHVLDSHHTIKYLTFAIWAATALLAAHRTFKEEKKIKPGPDENNQAAADKKDEPRNIFVRHYIKSAVGALIFVWAFIWVVDRFVTPFIDGKVIPAINHSTVDAELDD
jgi:hypothetical protein